MSSGAPKVSIVVVAHSDRQGLERCFASIRDWAAMPAQTILVDNASTDGTIPWVRESHPEVEIVELDRNLGVAARQHGLERVQAPLTMFLDSDAALTEGALPAMVDALDRNPGWGLIGPRLVGDDGELQPSSRRYPPRILPLFRRGPQARWLGNTRLVRRHLMADVEHDVVRPVLYVIGACQLFRTALGRAAGPFADWMFLGPDDIDWCIRIRDAGGEIVYFPEATVIHSYQRRSKRAPVSRLAWRHLAAFARFQWKYRKRRRALLELQDELDRRAEAP